MKTVNQLIEELYSKSWQNRIKSKTIKLGVNLDSTVNDTMILFLGNFLTKVNNLVKQRNHEKLSKSNQQIQQYSLSENYSINFGDSGKLSRNSTVNNGKTSSAIEVREQHEIQVSQNDRNDSDGRSGRNGSQTQSTELRTRSGKDPASFFNRILDDTVELLKDERQLARDSRQLARDSRQLARDSRQLAREAIEIAQQGIGIAITSTFGSLEGMPDGSLQQVPRAIEQTTIEVKSVKVNNTNNQINHEKLTESTTTNQQIPIQQRDKSDNLLSDNDDRRHGNAGSVTSTEVSRTTVGDRQATISQQRFDNSKTGKQTENIRENVKQQFLRNSQGIQQSIKEQSQATRRVAQESRKIAAIATENGTIAAVSLGMVEQLLHERDGHNDGRTVGNLEQQTIEVDSKEYK